MKHQMNGLFTALLLSASITGFAQQKTPKITDIKVMDSGLCENQMNTGTCWSFSGMSFFQAEINRIGKFKNLNLSEMFVVKNLYPLKAENYIRMHGKANFGEGGEFTDDLLCLKQFGLVPQAAYNGNQGLNYDHSKLVKSLDSIVTQSAKATDKLDPKWKTDFQQTLNKGMGEAPESFSFEGKTYTPKTFAQATGLNAEDYVLITSYTHHPYFSKFVLEVPDNWNWEGMYNVPLEDLSKITETALTKGYTVGWGADVSGMFNQGSNIQQLGVIMGEERTVTPEKRQRGFDSYENQDDHAMHIVGLAKDENGKTFFKVKNSWGKAAPSGEYFYTSENYFSMMTTSIMVNKNAIPKEIRKKLHI